MLTLCLALVFLLPTEMGVRHGASMAADLGFGVSYHIMALEPDDWRGIAARDMAGAYEEVDAQLAELVPKTGAGFVGEALAPDAEAMAQVGRLNRFRDELTVLVTMGRVIRPAPALQ